MPFVLAVGCSHPPSSALRASSGDGSRSILHTPPQRGAAGAAWWISFQLTPSRSFPNAHQGGYPPRSRADPWTLPHPREGSRAATLSPFDPPLRGAAFCVHGRGSGGDMTPPFFRPAEQARGGPRSGPIPPAEPGRTEVLRSKKP